MKRTHMNLQILLMIAFLAMAGGWANAQHAHASPQRSAAQHHNNAQGFEGMTFIPAGTYVRFLKSDQKKPTKDIDAFYIDTHAVTNKDYLAFVRENPQWARSNITRVFADHSYLKHWAGDYDLGDVSEDSPVIWVSWFAADAYAKWSGKRLPSYEEWEYAGGAPPVGEDDRKLTAIILQWYSKPAGKTVADVRSTFENTFGVWDMHGLVWEWVHDFNSVITGGDSRSEGNLDQGLYCAAGSLNAEDKEDYASFMRFAFREGLQARQTSKSLGFRCVKTP